jgi:hypothetical protein
MHQSEITTEHIPSLLSEASFDVARIVNEYIDWAAFQDLRNDSLDVCRRSCDIETDSLSTGFFQRR